MSAIEQGPSLNYTAALNVVFLVVAAGLVVRFLRTNGPAMLHMMNASPDAMDMGHGEHEGQVDQAEHMEHA